MSWGFQKPGGNGIRRQGQGDTQRPWDGRWDTWEVVLAELKGLWYLIPPPGACQAG